MRGFVKVATSGIAPDLAGGGVGQLRAGLAPARQAYGATVAQGISGLAIVHWLPRIFG